MSLEATRCQSCKLLPYRHEDCGSKLVGGSRRGGAVRVDRDSSGKPETVIVCREYNPTLSGKKILFTSLWKDIWKLP